MTKIKYIEWSPKAETINLIDRCNQIIQAYESQGFSLTLRQLYYQLVSRNIVPNTERSYKRVGSTVSKARKSGMISWTAIEDRTRNLSKISTWDEPADIVESAVRSYKIDFWEDQPARVEVWVEKEALSGVVQTACQPLRVPYFSCRGYSSDSESWAAARRAMQARGSGQDFIVLHLGDHDPSGIDMSRDIQDRFELYGATVQFKRLALNMSQIEVMKPPPNPAKMTDSRAGGYVEKFGRSSWELDAIEPSALVDLIRREINAEIDDVAWGYSQDREEADIEKLKSFADQI